MNTKTPSPVTVSAQPLERAADRLLIPSSIGVPRRPPSDVVWTFEGDALGMAWSVRAIGPVGASKTVFDALIRDSLEAASAVFDRARRDSEINRFNAAPTGFWALSDGFWGLLDATMDMGDETDGAVDPTLGGLIDLWSDGRSPGEEALEAVKPVTGWQGLRMNRPAQAALQPGGLTLDFEAVLAGHLADAVGDRLNQAGATSHRVHVGPAVTGAGVLPDAQPWWAAIPGSGVAPLSPIVAALVDRAVATVDRRDGRRAIEGREAAPVTHGLMAVSVLDRSAFRAQALAHAVMIMGPFDGPAYTEALNIPAHFLSQGARGWEESLSPAMAAQVDTPGEASA